MHNKCGMEDYSNISTGRSTPNNLYEKLAMESAQSNPTAGHVIQKQLGDPRLSDCVKMSQYFDTSKGGIEIHYVWNQVKNIFFDFKFK